MTETRLHGIDFTSAPSRAKRIVVASGGLRDDGLAVDALASFADWPPFEAWLRHPGPWVGGFDFPFSLPRDLVASLGWPGEWPALIDHYAALSRAEIRDVFKAFCDARPTGAKFAHRACDLPAGASPSMKWVNPPVAWMLHAGAPRLIAAGVHIPCLKDGDRSRVALEAYPGFVARAIVGHVSYKSDDVAKQTPERRAARGRILKALEAGACDWLPRLAVNPAIRKRCLDDGSGDTLDAVLCALQAAYGQLRRRRNFGLPPGHALEGWIVGVPHG